MIIDLTNKDFTILFSYDFGPDAVEFNIAYEPHPTNRDYILSMTYKGYKRAWGSTREDLIQLKEKLINLLEATK